MLYLEDFSRPKIIWKRIGFTFDNKGCPGLDSTCFAAGEHIEYLCCVLNSMMGHYLLKDSPKTGTGDLLVSVQAIEPAHIPYNAQVFEQLYDKSLKLEIPLFVVMPKHINAIVYIDGETICGMKGRDAMNNGNHGDAMNNGILETR